MRGEESGRKEEKCRRDEPKNVGLKLPRRSFVN